jgi:N-carbamoyl-L-amino-acid hydrolase
VTLSLDVRAPDLAELERIGAALAVETTPRNDPAPMDAGVRALLAAELATRALPAPELVSWAGHDAGVLAARGVPSAMLFVRSLAGGASHTPEEDSSPADVALAVDVLAAALEQLSARGS